MERSTPPSKVSRAQRLSAMIDSLHAVQSNEDLLGLNQSQPGNEDENGDDTRLTPPGPIPFAQPPRSYLSAGSSPYQGSSSMSSYSGVVGEAVEAVRGGQEQTHEVQPLNLRDTMSDLALNHNVESMNISSTDDDDNDTGPHLPTLPTEEVLRKTSYVNRLPSFAREGSQTPVETIVAISSSQKSTSTSTESPSKGSIPSHLDLTKDHSVHENQSHTEEEDSVSRTEVELASLNIRDPSHQSTETNINLNSFANADIIEVSDSESITSSVVKPLQPIEEQQKLDLPPSPVAPPRNKNRPRANLLPTAPLVPESDASVNNRQSVISMQSTNKSESYYSAASFLPESANADMHNPLQYMAQNTSKDVANPIYYSKPQQHPHEGIMGNTPSKIHTNDMDNIYEDIHPATLPPKKDGRAQNVIQMTPHTGKKEKKSPRKKQHKKGKKSKEIRSFDVDTINELLNVTSGTLIGSEFTNLGMQPKEKQLLERLVDSLSRLTADMVLDPNRYDEGLRRLNKATKALEGFQGN